MSNPFVLQHESGRQKGEAKMQSTQGHSILRWKVSEWEAVAKAALPFLASGMAPSRAMYKAQRSVLPRNRQRDERGCQLVYMKQKSPGRPALHGFDDYVRKAKQLPAEDFKPYFPPPPSSEVPTFPPGSVGVKRGQNKPIPVKATGNKRGGAGQHWTEEEWSKIAIEVHHMQQAGDTRTLGRLMCEAQIAILSPYRWRAEGGIMQGNFNNLNQKRLIKAWETAHPPAPAEPPAAEPLPAQVIEMVTQPLPPAPAPAPAPAPQQTAQEAPKPRQAPTPLQLPLSTFAGSMQAFASVFESALDTLLRDHEAHIISAMDKRLHSAAGEIADVVASQIREGLRRTVLETMAAELGGPVSTATAPPSIPPAPSTPTPPSPPPAPIAPAAPSNEDVAAAALAMGPGATAAARAAAVPVVYKGQPRGAAAVDLIADESEAGKLKVDIVGLSGAYLGEVRGAFNGHTSLRFIEAEKAESWIPRKAAHVILNAKHTNQVPILKCARYGIKPQMIRGGAAAFIHAIEALHQAEGIER